MAEDYLDINDITSELNLVLLEIKNNQSKLITLGLQYINKMSGAISSVQNDNFFLLRDNLIYRLNSIHNHLDILVSVQNWAEQNYSRLDIESDHIPFVISQAERLSGIFDSIVFHSASLYDYTGNLIEYVCGNKSKVTLKWNNAIQAARDKNNPISKSPVSSVILTHHKEFVDKLFGHRSTLIHDKMDSVSAKTSLSLVDLKRSFVIFAPKRFMQQIPFLKDLSRNKKCTMRYVSFWLTHKVYESFSLILDSLSQHMSQNHKIDKDNSLFIIKDRSGNFHDI